MCFTVSIRPSTEQYTVPESAAVLFVYQLDFFLDRSSNSFSKLMLYIFEVIIIAGPSENFGPSIKFWSTNVAVA